VGLTTAFDLVFAAGVAAATLALSEASAAPAAV